MISQRQRRVARRILQAVSDIVETQVHDPRLGVITLTSATVSADLRYAVIYFSSLASGPSRGSPAEILAGAAGFVRRELGRSLELRYTPAIRFERDETFERAERIDRLLASAGRCHGDESGGDEPERKDS